MKQNIVIIGAGEIGKAIAFILKDKGEINFWDKDISKAPNQKPLEKIVPQGDFLFFCVPSWAIRQAATEIEPFLNKKTIIISLAKGLEESSQKTAYQILEEVLPKESQITILSGPMIAEELIQNKSAVGVIASKNMEIFKKIEELFEGKEATNLHVEYSPDISGVALCGVLKNIYALALGIAEGLKWGSDIKGWLVSESVKEMREIVKILGGNATTVLGPAGVGDLITTGFSGYSANHQIGKELAEKNAYSKQGEGAISLPIIIQLLGKNTKNLRVLKSLEQGILNKKDIKKTFEDLIKGI